ncbi:MAG: glycine cleavage system aminomethyltransferase GcvT [Candidatus Diapherotrites archaeon]
MEEEMKRTPLFAEHERLGAKMVVFGGWEMPVYYSTLMDEHNTVRSAAGLFDTSHMGEIIVTGSEAEQLLEKVMTRKIKGAANGSMHLSVMCNEKGGIIDDCTVYKFGAEKFMVVVNAGTREKDFRWIDLQARKQNLDAEVVQASDFFGKLDLQGPNAEKILGKCIANGTDLKKLHYYYFLETELFGVPAIVSRSGYTGEEGFELYFPRDKTVFIWQRLFEAGKEFGLKPCALGCRDTLRLECAYMLYGNDIDEQHSPIEATYEWVVSFDKDFIGKKALSEQKMAGLSRKLVGFEMIDKAIARHGYKCIKDDRKIGIVTSGSYSPTLKKNIGLAYIEAPYAEKGGEFEVEVRENNYNAIVVSIPFYKRGR